MSSAPTDSGSGRSGAASADGGTSAGPADLRRDGTGVVIGRFMPPHNGHRYLVNFAQRYCSDVTVLVCTLPDEPIAGKLRFRWMRELFPAANLVHITDQIPEARREVPGSYRIWADAVRRHMPAGTDYVFASETYGADLAGELGAQFVPVDPARRLFPISATDIRRDPMTHWEFIPPVVRTFYLRRVVVLGSAEEAPTLPESDNFLAHDLARHFRTLYVANYADFRARRDSSVHERIERGLRNSADYSRGQQASEEALAAQANRVLFCETTPDLLAAGAQSAHASARAPEREPSAGSDDSYDLYLLDGTDAERAYASRLQSRGVRFDVLTGSRKDRFSRAVNLVTELLYPSK